MTPVEIYLDEGLFLETGTGRTEMVVPGVPMIINYTGDNYGAIVTIKHADGERMTGFPMTEVGEEKTVRFEQTIHLPVEKDRPKDVKVKKTLKFKRI